MTPTLTNHARQRCAEMGISTKVAKRIAQNPSVTYGHPVAANAGKIVQSAVEPAYAVVIDLECDPPEILTVLYVQDGEYEGTGRCKKYA